MKDPENTRTTVAAIVIASVLVFWGCEKPDTKVDPSAVRSVEPKTGAPSEAQFRHKVECEKYRDKLRDVAEHDQFEIEAIYRTPYSASRNSCLVAKYTIFYATKRHGETEVAEIADILSQETVWQKQYEGSVRYWDVEAELDKQLQIIN